MVARRRLGRVGVVAPVPPRARRAPGAFRRHTGAVAGTARTNPGAVIAPGATTRAYRTAAHRATCRVAAARTSACTCRNAAARAGQTTQRDACTAAHTGDAATDEPAARNHAPHASHNEPHGTRAPSASQRGRTPIPIGNPARRRIRGSARPTDHHAAPHRHAHPHRRNKHHAPSCSTAHKTPPPTIMAQAWRAPDRIVAELKKQNL